MARVHKANQPRVCFQKTHPCRNKHLSFIAFAQLVIGIDEHFCRVIPSFGVIPYYGFASHHEHGCRYTLTGNIRHKESQLLFVQQIEIIKISAHLFGGVHCCVQTEVCSVRIGRKYGRKR